MADKFPNDDIQFIPSVDYNQWLKRWDTQLNESNNQNSLKVPRVIQSTNKKTLLKTLGTSEYTDL